MKIVGLVAFILMSFCISAQNVEITGQVDNPNSEYIVFYTESAILDSVLLNKGHFKSNFSLDSLTKISFNDGKEYGSFYLKPNQKTQIYLNALLFDESLTFNGAYSQLNNFRTAELRAFEQYIDQLSSISPDVNFSDTNKVFEEMRTIQSTLQANLDYGIATYPEIKSYFEIRKQSLVKATDHFFYHKKFEIEIFHLKNNSRGLKFDDFIAEDLKGNKKSLQDYLGKPIVIDFWATWCGPCKKEMPHLKKIEEKFEGQINVLSINCYDKKKNWKSQAEKIGAENSIHISEENFENLKNEYAIYYIPRFIILDQNGTIVDIHADRPSSGLDEQISLLLKKQ